MHHIFRISKKEVRPSSVQHLVAGTAVAEAGALDGLLLGDGDDVGGDGVELSRVNG